MLNAIAVYEFDEKSNTYKRIKHSQQEKSKFGFFSISNQLKDLEENRLPNLPDDMATGEINWYQSIS